MHQDKNKILSDQEAIIDSEVITTSGAVDGGLSSIKSEERAYKLFNGSKWDVNKQTILIPLFIDEFIDKLNREELWKKLQEKNSEHIFKWSDEHLLEFFNQVLPQSSTLSFSELITREFPPARYALEPYFEMGAVNMVSAPPNTWKSWLLFYFASFIASGTPVFDKFATTKMNVLIVNEEDSFRAIQDRFKLLHITDETLPIYFRVAQGAKLEDKFIKEIIKECAEKDIKLVMFDSLRSMHEAEENDSTAMQLVMDQLKKLAREDITVIFTHHHRKKSAFSKGDDAEASRGSSAINAAVSGHISLDEEERELGRFLIVRHLKSKIGQKAEPMEIKIIQEPNKIEFHYEGQFKSGEGKLMQTKNAIMSLMEVGEIKTASDFINLDIAGASVIRASLAELVRYGTISCYTRAEARLKGLVPLLGGQSKEKIYMLPTDAEAKMSDMYEEI